MARRSATAPAPRHVKPVISVWATPSRPHPGPALPAEPRTPPPRPRIPCLAGACATALAAASRASRTTSDNYVHHGHLGDFLRVDFLAKAPVESAQDSFDDLTANGNLSKASSSHCGYYIIGSGYLHCAPRVAP